MIIEYSYSFGFGIIGLLLSDVSIINIIEPIESIPDKLILIISLYDIIYIYI